MKPEEIKACWKDPHNRKWGFYYCKADPRVIVPRRFKCMGWTVNAARPGAIAALLCILVILIVPALLVRAYGGTDVASLLTIAASIVLVCVLCAYLSSTNRSRR